MVEFAINSSINATTGYAPFELNFGYILQSGQHILTDTGFKSVKQFSHQAVWNLIDVPDCKILYILLLVDIYAQRIYLCFI